MQGNEVGSRNATERLGSCDVSYTTVNCGAQCSNSGKTLTDSTTILEITATVEGGLLRPFSRLLARDAVSMGNSYRRFEGTNLR
jgi:hypothetical protein